MRHILLVEDEQDISDLMKIQLQALGEKVTVIADGAQALNFIQTSEEKIDLYILDRMLPNANGLEICKFLRMYQKTKLSPILMVTALTKPEQIVEGLEAGADDYVTKPFDTTILMARVRSLLRRSEYITTPDQETPISGNILAIDNLKVDTVQCKVWLEGSEIELTLSEYKLLCTFMKEPGKVMTRNHLVNEIQDGPVHVTDRTIDTHIFGLRKKLGNYSKLIETIRGIGYRVASDFKA